MERIPRWWGWVWLVGGGAGLLGILVGVVVGMGALGSTARHAHAGLEVVGDTVRAVDDGVASLDASLEVAADALRDAQGSASDVAVTLTQISSVTGDLGVLVGRDVPASIDAVRDAMPPLIDTARLVDRTMRALTLVGVEYDPELPLDDALTELDRRLAGIPERLRGTDEVVESVADGLAGLGSQALASAEQMAAVRSQMVEVSERLDEFRGLGDEALTLVASTSVSVERQTGRARWLLVGAAVVMAVTSSVPLVVGWAVVTGHRSR